MVLTHLRETTPGFWFLALVLRPGEIIADPLSHKIALTDCAVLYLEKKCPHS